MTSATCTLNDHSGAFGLGFGLGFDALYAGRVIFDIPDTTDDDVDQPDLASYFNSVIGG